MKPGSPGARQPPSRSANRLPHTPRLAGVSDTDAKDALGAHAREELGITPNQAAKPLQAALISAAIFAVGAAIPLFTAFMIPRAFLIPAVVAISLFFLAVLGGVAAQTGGANPWIGATRVAFWSALAMGVTAGVGALFGVSV